MKEKLIDLKEKSVIALAIVGILSIGLTIVRLVTAKRASAEQKFGVEMEPEEDIHTNINT